MCVALRVLGPPVGRRPKDAERPRGGRNPTPSTLRRREPAYHQRRHPSPLVCPARARARRALRTPRLGRRGFRGRRTSPPRARGAAGTRAPRRWVVVATWSRAVYRGRGGEDHRVNAVGAKWHSRGVCGEGSRTGGSQYRGCRACGEDYASSVILHTFVSRRVAGGGSGSRQQLDRAHRSRCVCEPCVECDERGPDQLGQRDIRRVVRRKVRPQLPAALEQGQVRNPPDRQ